MFLSNFKPLHPAKIPSSLHNIALSSEKVCLVWIRWERCTDQDSFISYMWVDFDVGAQQGMDFFPEGSVIMDYGWKKQFEVKNILMMNLFLTNMQRFASQVFNWWTGVMWIIVMFLSAVWTHSDGTHSLQSSHWWACDVMLHFSKSGPWRYKLIYISKKISFKIISIF